MKNMCSQSLIVQQSYQCSPTLEAVFKTQH